MKQAKAPFLIWKQVLLGPSFSESTSCMGNKVRGSIVSSKSAGSNKKIFSAIKDNLVYSKGMNSVSANRPWETTLLIQVSCNMQNSIIITAENWAWTFQDYVLRRADQIPSTQLNKFWVLFQRGLLWISLAECTGAATSHFYPQSLSYYHFLAFWLKSSVVSV